MESKMKRLIFCIMVVTVWLIHLTSSPVLAAQEKRIALVIGNGAYKSAPLRNPVNDAGDIADVLEKLGFSVALKTDADQRSMERAIRDFGKKLRTGGVGLFYYAGHGIQVKGRNYLIPIGAAIESESDVKYESVDAGRVLGKMEDAGNSLNVIILDACRNNPFGRSFRSSDKGLAKMDAPTGSILAYATAPGSVASDGPGRNGLYTSALLKHMMTAGLTIEKMFKQVRIDVVGDSGKKQVPWESSSLTGDFYFNADRAISVVPTKTTATPYNAELEKEKAGLLKKRQELEKLKLEIERKKLEEEIKRLEAEKANIVKKETPKVASISPEDTKAKIIARDARYEKQANGIVNDTKTGLEWYVGPDEGKTLNEAKSWVANLTVGGGDWRMPTRKELRSLYQKGVGSRNMTPLLKFTGWYVWSGETKGSSSAWIFDFSIGNGNWHFRTYSKSYRGFAVRSRK